MSFARIRIRWEKLNDHLSPSCGDFESLALLLGVAGAGAAYALYQAQRQAHQIGLKIILCI